MMPDEVMRVFGVSECYKLRNSRFLVPLYEMQENRMKGCTAEL